MKEFIMKLIKIGHLPKNKVDRYQKEIRDTEWNSIAEYIYENSHFLDIGCGNGFSLVKAKDEKKCSVVGIDPSPNLAGVHWQSNEGKIQEKPNIEIIKGVAEHIPFKDSVFDVVYSSHVLEHVSDKAKSLKEAKRVLKDDGIIIIGMPTSTMAIINFFSNLLLTSHERMLKYIASLFNKANSKKGIFLKHVFFAPSHSEPSKTVLFDICAYRTNKWAEILKKEFEIIETIFPALYPYPDYFQLFKKKKMNNVGSSVFFICKNKFDK
jgi:ubiquinone/menaquinone biosynthesis C-methylase UbiE